MPPSSAVPTGKAESDLVTTAAATAAVVGAAVATGLAASTEDEVSTSSDDRNASNDADESSPSLFDDEPINEEPNFLADEFANENDGEDADESRIETIHDEEDIESKESVATKLNDSSDESLTRESKDRTKSKSSEAAYRYGDNLSNVLFELDETDNDDNESSIETLDSDESSEPIDKPQATESDRLERLEGRRDSIRKRTAEETASAPIERLGLYIDEVDDPDGPLRPENVKAHMQKLADEAHQVIETDQIRRLYQERDAARRAAVDAELARQLESAAQAGRPVDPEALRIDIDEAYRSREETARKRELDRLSLLNEAYFHADPEPWYFAGVEAMNRHVAGILAFADAKAANESADVLEGAGAPSERANIHFALREAEGRLTHDIKRLMSLIEETADSDDAAPYAHLLAKRREALSHVAALSAALAQDEAEAAAEMAAELSGKNAHSAEAALSNLPHPTLARLRGLLGCSAPQCRSDEIRSGSAYGARWGSFGSLCRSSRWTAICVSAQGSPSSAARNCASVP